MSNYTIIVSVFGTKYSVRYSNLETFEVSSMQTLYNKGMEKSAWKRNEWSTIFRNLQIDETRDTCRIVVFSDTPTTCPNSATGEKWEINELAEIKNHFEIHASKWVINNHELPVSKWTKLFPRDSSAEKVYVTTNPVLEVAVSKSENEESDLYHYLRKKALDNLA